MKDQEMILKVQAFVDGELSAAEQGQMAALAARDQEVHALVKELKQTRQALAEYDEAMDLPESREFYWSKIQRQIESLPVQRQKQTGTSLAAMLARWWIPASCLFALVMAGFMLLGERRVADEGVNWQAAYDGVNAFTYRDYEEGMTLLWISYSADNAVANPEEAATIN